MAENPKDPKNLQHYIMVTHAPLVNMAIKSLKASGNIPEHMEDWEFHEQGMRGLMEALRDYKHDVAQRINPESKNPFATFASSRIRGRIQDHAQSMHAIPKHIRQQAKGFERQQKLQEAAAPAVTQPVAPKKEGE